MSSHSTFSKMLDQVLPPMPPFLEMITLQAETMATGLAIAVEYLSTEDPAKIKEVAIIETKAKELRQKHLEKLHQSFSTPIDRIDLLSAINSLETPIESMRQVVEEMHALKITSDNYCLEMAIIIRETAHALHRGYAKLATNPGMAEPEAQMGLLCLPHVDEVYRKALNKLYIIEDDVKLLQSKEADAKINAFIHIVDMLKRHDEYQHLRDIADNISKAASVLHGIVIQIG